MGAGLDSLAGELNNCIGTPTDCGVPPKRHRGVALAWRELGCREVILVAQRYESVARQGEDKSGFSGGSRPFSKVALLMAKAPEPVALGLLIVCSIALYANSLFNSFVDDDRDLVLGNIYIRDLHHLREIFTSAAGPANYYRPMMNLGFLVCHQLFGFNSPGFHLMSVLLNAGVVYLMFQVGQRVFKSWAVAFTAAAVFAFHPVHTEPVAWIAATQDLELGFFCLLTFLLFLDLSPPVVGWAPRRYLAMTGAFALALLSKEQAVTLSLLATFYEHFQRADRKQTTLRQKVVRYGPLWLVLPFYFPLRAYSLGGFAPKDRFPDMTAYQTCLSAFALIGQYLGKLLWPAHLAAFYDFRKSESLLDVRVLLGMLSCLVALALLLVLWNRARSACFGMLWLFVTLLPVLNPHWLGPSPFGERYLYLPSVGFSWLIASGLVLLYQRFGSSPRKRAIVYAALGAIAVLSAIRIISRNRDWRNETAFFTRSFPDANRSAGVANACGPCSEE